MMDQEQSMLSSSSPSASSISIATQPESQRSNTEALTSSPPSTQTQPFSASPFEETTSAALRSPQLLLLATQPCTQVENRHDTATTMTTTTATGRSNDARGDGRRREEEDDDRVETSRPIAPASTITTRPRGDVVVAAVPEISKRRPRGCGNDDDDDDNDDDGRHRCDLFGVAAGRTNDVGLNNGGDTAIRKRSGTAKNRVGNYDDDDDMIDHRTDYDALLLCENDDDDDDDDERAPGRRNPTSPSAAAPRASMMPATTTDAMMTDESDPNASASSSATATATARDVGIDALRNDSRRVEPTIPIVGSTEEEAAKKEKLTTEPRPRERPDAAVTRGDRGVAIGGSATHGRDDDDGLPVETSRRHHARRKVSNPYAKKPTSAKRTFDMIGRGSVSGISSAGDRRPKSATADGSTDATDADSAASSAAAPRKRVFNPYAKSRQTPNRQSSVRNPYSKTTTGAVAPPITLAKNGAAERGRGAPPTAAAAAVANPPKKFHRAGISMSLPMAERLPSRNVSYQPAEILTVGELYRYLYDGSDDRRHSVRKCAGSEDADVVANESSTVVVARELTSVRITGTLLSVSTSRLRDGGNGGTTRGDNLYDGGTFLLVGDPLENTRFPRKEIPSRRSEGDPAADAVVVAATPSVSRANSKARLTSILRNKKAPASLSAASSADETPDSDGAAARDGISANRPSTAETPAANASDGGCNSANAASRNKPMNRGILNTNKKKKLVYNGGGKRLSFGGKGLGGRGRGLIGQKFVTPKRANATGPLSSANRGLANRAVVSTLKKRAISSVNPVGAGSTKNPLPDNIIQRHRSPIVPVWIGSFYNGDGLDGSFVGDLVMIMGEIVMERCATCWNSRCRNGNGGDEENVKASSAGVNEFNNNTNEEASSNQSHKPLAPPARIEGVKDAAISIAASAVKISGGSPSSRSGCSRCTRFIRARFVKNANGTDMSLQREALKARRKYVRERRREMECIIPTSVTKEGLYSVGCGPPF